MVGQIRELIQAPEIVVSTHNSLKKLGNIPPEFGLTEVSKTIKNFDKFWGKLDPISQHRVVQLLVKRVDINTNSVQVHLRSEGFQTLTNKYKNGEDYEHSHIT